MDQNYNIINIEEINDFICRLKCKRPLMSKYIDTKVKKYLKNDSYIVHSRSYAFILLFKIVFGRASSKEKRIFNKNGIFGHYHFVYCSSLLFERILKVLDFASLRPENSGITFKEVLFDYQTQESKTESIDLLKLTNDLDYSVVLDLPKYQVWKLLSLKSYRQEGCLMKNCIGRVVLPHSSFYILSIREKGPEMIPLISLKVCSENKVVIEAKERVNHPVSQYFSLYSLVIKKLNIKQ